MSKGKWRRPTPSEIKRAVQAVMGSGLPVAQVCVSEDGSITIDTKPPSPKPADDADEWRVSS
jgi:hypothetical protein